MFNIDCSSRISSKIVATVIFSFENEFSHQIPIQNRTNFVVTKMRFKNCVVPFSVSIIPLIRAQSTIQVDYKLPHSAPVHCVGACNQLEWLIEHELMEL